MRTIFKTAAAASLVAATSLAAVQPAQAHVGAGTAVVAGILGLGVGAAIASDHPHYRGYYAPPPPPPPPGYYGYGYAPPPPPPAREVCDVRYGYYGEPHRHCWLERY
ncbi:MAG: hypothetical protein JOY99_09655 [Sphingomonadaceae bacterium]|nr:hypothetical protein [Sphingomonadaceae bacterium]